MTPFTRSARAIALLAASVAAQATLASGQEQAPKVVHKSTSALLDSVISRTAPAYPAWARHSGSTTALVKAAVGEDGRAISAVVVSGDRLLGWSAIEALRQWRWPPTVQDGSPVTVVGLLSFTLAADGSVTSNSAQPAGVSDAAPPTDYELLYPTTIAFFKEVGEVSKRFEQVPDVAIRINDSKEQPLLIENAMVRAIKREPDQAVSTGDWLMRVILVLRNSTDKRVTSARVRFTNWQGHTSFLAQVWSGKGDPQDRCAKIISKMSVSGDPAGFEVEVESVQFEGGDRWTSNRPPPGAALSASAALPAPSPAPAASPDPSVAPRTPVPGEIHPPTIPVPGEIRPPTLTPPGAPPGAEVDSRPRALNTPRPNYTEDARRNGVMGTSRVRVLVSADGSVKMVRILTSLPDGLTEEAIRAAYQIKFKPAMKDGQPVAFWQAVDVDFNLR